MTATTSPAFAPMRGLRVSRLRAADLDDRTATYLFVLLLAFAAVWRLALFNGPLGSDDVTYLSRALEISRGQWTSADYNGALRYGFNIPAGAMLWLFGRGEFQANLWPLACSLAEIAAVWWYCRSRFDNRVALFAALLLATAPLHVAAATRIHADAVASGFLTIAFVLFLESENRRSRGLAFAAGLAMGMVFWVKELLGLALLAFLAWPLVARRFTLRWAWVAAGGLVMLLGHFALMQAIAGDPLHLFRTVFGQIATSFVEGGKGEDSPAYYLRYLLFDVRHSGLLGPLAVAGFTLAARGRRAGEDRGAGFIQAAFWALSLLLVLSLFPVSLAPLRFAMKQSNYLTVFLAPLAILAALALARLPRAGRWLAWLGVLALALPLAILEQQSYRVFVSNSRAVAEFARANPDDLILGTRNNSGITRFEALTYDEPRLRDSVRQLSVRTPEDTPHPKPGGRLLAVEDRETAGWNPNDHRLATVPPCWTLLQPLEPRGLGAGSTFADRVAALAARLPAPWGPRLAQPFARLARPLPARLWLLPPADPWCRGEVAHAGAGPAPER